LVCVILIGLVTVAPAVAAQAELITAAGAGDLAQAPIGTTALTAASKNGHVQIVRDLPAANLPTG
jgi:hypothetical protein